jgi:hypothetical protein
MQFADEDFNGLLSFSEFNKSVTFAKQIQSSFDLKKWIMAREKVTNLGQFYATLEKVNLNRTSIAQILKVKQGDYESGIITDIEFKDLLRISELGLSDQGLNDLTIYAVKGSERNTSTAEVSKDSLKTQHSLIHMQNFFKSILPVMEYLKNQARGLNNVDNSKLEINRKQEIGSRLDSTKK